MSTPTSSQPPPARARGTQAGHGSPPIYPPPVYACPRSRSKLATPPHRSLIPPQNPTKVLKFSSPQISKFSNSPPDNISIEDETSVPGEVSGVPAEDESPADDPTPIVPAEVQTPAATPAKVRATIDDEVATSTSVLLPATPDDSEIHKAGAPATAEGPPGEALHHQANVHAILTEVYVPAEGKVPEAATLTTTEASPGDAPDTSEVQLTAPYEAEGHTQPAEVKTPATPTETNNKTTPIGEDLPEEVPATSNEVVTLAPDAYA